MSCKVPRSYPRRARARICRLSSRASAWRSPRRFRSTATRRTDAAFWHSGPAAPRCRRSTPKVTLERRAESARGDWFCNKCRAGDGFKLLQEVKSRYPDVLVILVTGFGTIENAGTDGSGSTDGPYYEPSQYEIQKHDTDRFSFNDQWDQHVRYYKASPGQDNIWGGSDARFDTSHNEDSDEIHAVLADDELGRRRVGQVREPGEDAAGLNRAR